LGYGDFVKLKIGYIEQLSLKPLHPHMRSRLKHKS
jgi:hypothetical protein